MSSNQQHDFAMPPLEYGWRPRLSLSAVMTSLLMMSLDAHHYGADIKACEDMVPRHDSRQRADNPPYYIQVSNTTYIPGVPITVTLSAYSGSAYKGFLMQARVTGTGEAVGTFTPIQGSQLICPMNAGLTHTNADPKTSLTFSWNPPDTLRGPVQFKATVVESQYSYWVAIPSQVISEGQTTTTVPPTSTSTATSTSTTTLLTTSDDSMATSTLTPESTRQATANSSDTAVVGDGAGAFVSPSVVCVLVSLIAVCILGRVENFG